MEQAIIKYMHSFVGERKAAIYEEKFRRIEEDGVASSWNWCAFFVAPCWLIYRKLYSLFFMYIAITCCADTCLSLLAVMRDDLTIETPVVAVTQCIIVIIVSVVFAVKGDSFYMRRILHYLHRLHYYHLLQ